MTQGKLGWLLRVGTLALVSCSKPHTNGPQHASIVTTPDASPVAPQADSGARTASPASAAIQIQRPNVTNRLPSPKWDEELDNDQALTSWADWAGTVAFTLLGKDRQANWMIDVRAYMEFYNAPQMDWFIDTPNVKSYDQQMAIRKRFLDARPGYSLSTFGLASHRPPKWDANGATAYFHEQSEKWVERKPESWTQCKYPKPYPDAVLRNGIGEPGIKILTDRDLVFHVNREGKIDSFRIIPLGFIKYTVTKPTQCWLIPGNNDKEHDPFIAFRPGMAAPSSGQELGCPNTGLLAGVIVNGKVCYLDYPYVKQAPKQDHALPKDWSVYSPAIVMAPQTE